MTSLYPTQLIEDEYNDDDFPDIDEICEEIHEACKGWGTDEDVLIQALASKSPSQRCYLNKRYPKIYDGKDLDDLMKSECNGDFGFAIRLVAMKCNDAEVKLLRQCTEDTKEHVLYTIICGRTNDDIDLLKKTWYKTYNTDLGHVLASQLSGEFECLIINCLQGIEDKYSQDVHTDERAEEDAEAFYAAGEGKFGTDEAAMFRILCVSPPEHLKKVNMIYAEKYGNTLSKALKKELSGTTCDASVFHLNMKLRPYKTVAKAIKTSCAGFGTDEFSLTSHIVRYHQILSDTNSAHEEEYEKSIIDRIDSEVGGDYKKLLSAFVENAI